jgi:hypothetical protein
LRLAFLVFLDFVLVSEGTGASSGLAAAVGADASEGLPEPIFKENE